MSREGGESAPPFIKSVLHHSMPVFDFSNECSMLNLAPSGGTATQLQFQSWKVQKAEFNKITKWLSEVWFGFKKFALKSFPFCEPLEGCESLGLWVKKLALTVIFPIVGILAYVWISDFVIFN